MKKLYRLSLMFILAFGLLTSCGDNKKKKLTKEWRATQLDLSGTLISGDQVQMVYDFSEQGNFFCTEGGKTDEGTWELNEEGTRLTLNFTDEGRVVEMDVKELSDKKLVLSGEEFTMKKTLTLMARE